MKGILKLVLSGEGSVVPQSTVLESWGTRISIERKKGGTVCRMPEGSVESVTVFIHGVDFLFLPFGQNMIINLEPQSLCPAFIYANIVDFLKLSLKALYMFY